MTDYCVYNCGAVSHTVVSSVAYVGRNGQLYNEINEFTYNANFSGTVTEVSMILLFADNPIGTIELYTYGRNSIIPGVGNIVEISKITYLTYTFDNPVTDNNAIRFYIETDIDVLNLLYININIQI